MKECGPEEEECPDYKESEIREMREFILRG